MSPTNKLVFASLLTAFLVGSIFKLPTEFLSVVTVGAYAVALAALRVCIAVKNTKKVLRSFDSSGHIRSREPALQSPYYGSVSAARNAHRSDELISVNEFDYRNRWQHVIDGKMRIGDAERDQIIDELTEHFGKGRITAMEFSDRADQTLIAATNADLFKIVNDLPPISAIKRPWA